MLHAQQLCLHRGLTTYLLVTSSFSRVFFLHTLNPCGCLYITCLVLCTYCTSSCKEVCEPATASYGRLVFCVWASLRDQMLGESSVYIAGCTQRSSEYASHRIAGSTQRFGGGRCGGFNVTNKIQPLAKGLKVNYFSAEQYRSGTPGFFLEQTQGQPKKNELCTDFKHTALLIDCGSLLASRA